jgi:hypothetical protein
LWSTSVVSTAASSGLFVHFASPAATTARPSRTTRSTSSLSRVFAARELCSAGPHQAPTSVA